MKKLANLLFFLPLAVMPPLAAAPGLLFHWKVLAVVAAAAVLVLTQPPISVRDGRQNAATDRRSVFAITVASLANVWASLADWAYWKHADGSLSPLAAAGLAMMAGGLAFRVWAIRRLGRSFTSTVQLVENQRLVTSGPYRWVRHPSYAGASLLFAGIAVFLGSAAGLAVAMVGMGWAYRRRIEAEERLLFKSFGAEWLDYAERTPRLLPKIW